MITARRLFPVVCLLIVLCFSGYQSIAQYRLKGAVMGPDRKPVPLCKVFLQPVSDSLQPIYTFCDSLGSFAIDSIPGGRYTFGASDFSADGPTTMPLEIQGDTTIVCTMKIALTGVVVKATVPTFERKRDRFVFNTANSPLIVGNNVWEVLKQTPMVQASEQATLTILGNPQNVTVFINRKKFSLGGEDLMRFLKNMPSDNIVRIEILTIPPPFYDTDGPVIDIILKHLDINGLKGTATAALERSATTKGAGALTLDYNKNRFNQSFLLSGNGGEYYKSIDRGTYFKTPPYTTAQSDFETFVQRKGFSAYTDLRYELNPLWTTGLQLIGNGGNADNNSSGHEMNDNGLLPSAFTQTITGNNYLANGNAFLKYNSEKKEQYFEISADYLYSHNRQTNEFLSPAADASYKTDVLQDIRNIAVKSDLSRPLAHKIYLEAGAKWGYSQIRTPYEAYGLDDNHWKYMDAYSATFNYAEHVLSGYMSLEKDLSKKWSAKLGLRVENSFIRTRTESDRQQQQTRNYTFFFPIGYLNYQINERHSLSLTSKINNARPEYYTLNPARTMLGARTITEGNPYLQPSNGGIVELMYSYRQTWYAGLSYTLSQRLYTQVNEVLPPDTLLIKWQNWGNQNQVNFWIFTQRELLKNHWTCSFNTNIGYYRRSFYSDVAENSPNEENYQLSATLNNNFSNIFSRNLKMYCNFSFNTPGRYGLWADDKCSFRVDMGAVYAFPASGWRLGLAINDLLKYNDRSVYTTNETAIQKTRVLNNNDSRSIRLTISKSFGNLKAQKYQKRTTSNEEERQRIN